MARTEVVVAQDNWWLGVAEGILAILFGIAAVFWPGMTLVTLVYLFSAFILAWGIVEIIRGISGIGQSGTWWLTLVFGLFVLGVGVYLVRHPAVKFETFILLIGFTLIARGVIDVVAVFLEGSSLAAKTLNIIIGAAGVLAGIVILRHQVAGGVAFVWVLGLYYLIAGPLYIAMALDDKKVIESVNRR